MYAYDCCELCFQLVVIGGTLSCRRMPNGVWWDGGYGMNVSMLCHV